MWLRLLLTSILTTIWWVKVSTAPDKVVCYHGTWAYWRTGNGKFVVGDIDTKLCTHVHYAFIGINSDGTPHVTSDDLIFLSEYRNLKNINPELKLLIAVGGWSQGTVNFSIVAGNASYRRKFLDSAINLIRHFNFDGLDIDWEYPSSNNDRYNFVTLLSLFRETFNNHGYLLTLAVSVNTRYYDVPGIDRNLDYINVMTYDFCGSSNSTSCHHSSYSDAINGITAWKNAGASPNKLLLGIGAYGRTFTLRDPSNNGVGASVTGPGIAGPYTGEAGFLGYNEICEKLRAGWIQKWLNVLSVPCAYKGNQWVGYDDEQSITKKAKFAVDNNLGGIMVWSIDTDDFRGICGTPYPLLKAIKSGLRLNY